jgi:hypothetical protein
MPVFLDHTILEVRHLAFGMDRATFEATFERIRTSGTPYGDGPSTPTNRRGPGGSPGVHGATDSVSFHDPSGTPSKYLRRSGMNPPSESISEPFDRSMAGTRRPR